MTLRNVLVMLVLAGLAVLAWVTLGDPAPKGSNLPALFPAAFDRGSVTRVVCHYQGDELVFRRRVDRSDAWNIEKGTTAVRGDAAVVEDLLAALARQHVQNKFEKSRVGLDLAGFGLVSPEIAIELTMSAAAAGSGEAGASHVQTIRYGKRSAGSGETVYTDEGPGTDIWLVEAGVEQLIVNAVTSGSQSKRMTDLRLYDLGKLEVASGGVTKFAAERESSGIWRIAAPFKGFALPSEFETLLAKLVNAAVISWVEIGAVDMPRYGLDAPRAEVSFYGKLSTTPTTLVLGADLAEGGCYVFEKGVPNVARLPKEFAAAVMALLEDPLSVRDRSFSRIGIDGIGIKVKLPETTYELRKEGSTWDVVAPDRHPCEESIVRDALELLRSWETKEFQDTADPKDYGLDGTSSIEIALQGGGKTTLLIGKEATDGTYWAQRKSSEGDGGVERVDGAPVQLFGKGYAQFFKRVVVDLVPFFPELERIERNKGTGSPGDEVQEIVVTRDVTEGAKDPHWKTSEGPGVTGRLDNDALNRFVKVILLVEARGWFAAPPEKNAEMGFSTPKDESASVVVQFNTAKGEPTGGARQILHIGKKIESGGYYAKLGASPWAFVLSDADAKALMVPLTVTEKK